MIDVNDSREAGYHKTDESYCIAAHAEGERMVSNHDGISFAVYNRHASTYTAQEPEEYQHQGNDIKADEPYLNLVWC